MKVWKVKNHRKEKKYMLFRLLKKILTNAVIKLIVQVFGSVPVLGIAVRIFALAA